MNHTKAPTTPIDIGDLTKTYAVIREIGSGGMGSVVLARHRASGHNVAIKIASKEKFDAEALARFEREARLMARFQHRNIVRLYDVRQIGSGRVGIVMEYVRGVTLAHLLSEQPKLPLEQCTSILRDLGNALGHAHVRGVVHRDVKPHNVLIERESGVAKLSDFGIAKGAGDSAEVTAAGAVLGTPAYMSPEQIDGKEIDGRSDMYSLGILGWQIITGEQPWAGEPLYQLLFKQKHEALPPASALRPGVPANLLLALEGALEKDPVLRWASVADMLVQLDSNEPTAAMFERRARVASAAVARSSLRPFENATVQLPHSAPTALGDAAPLAGTASPDASATAMPLSTTAAPAPQQARTRPRWLRPAEFVAGAVAGSLVMLVALRALSPAGAPAAPTASPASTVPKAARATPSPSGPRSAPVTNAGATAPSGRPAGAQPLRSDERVRTASSPTNDEPTGTAAGSSQGGTTMSPVLARSEPSRVAAPDAFELGTISERIPWGNTSPRRPEGSRDPSAFLPVTRLGEGAHSAEATLMRRGQSFALAMRARTMVYAGDTKRARVVVDSALALDSRNGAAYVLRARLRIAQREIRDAWTDIELGERTGAHWEALSLSTMLNVWKSGPREARQRILPELRDALTPRRMLDPDRAVSLASAMAQIGDTSTALTLLELAAPDSRLPALLADPLLAPLRSSDRFVQVRRRASL